MSPSQYRLLIADDEEHTRIALVRAFQLKGYACQGAANGKEALQLLSQEKYDLLLLDLRMPEMDGVQVMNAARQLHPHLSVIILTAHASLDSAITAVKSGAADYLLKPQSINDLENAIQRALKQHSPRVQRNQLISFMQQSLEELQKTEFLNNPITTHTLQIDQERHQIILRAGEQERRVSLTQDQTHILQYLNEHIDKVVTCREIAQKVLGYPNLSEKEAESMVRPHILRIRRKIEPDPEKPQMLRTIRGCGYVLSLDPNY